MHTPGSDTDAWTKEEKHTKKTYAKVIGMAGLMLCHIHGAEKMKNKTQGTTTKRPVAMLTGRCLAFSHLPPKKKMIFPSKY